MKYSVQIFYGLKRIKKGFIYSFHSSITDWYKYCQNKNKFKKSQTYSYCLRTTDIEIFRSRILIESCSSLNDLNFIQTYISLKTYISFSIGESLNAKIELDITANSNSNLTEYVEIFKMTNVTTVQLMYLLWIKAKIKFLWKPWLKNKPVINISANRSIILFKYRDCLLKHIYLEE